MSEGVFSVMKKMDLTTLEMFFSRKDNTLFMRGMKEWDDDLQFSRYTMDFSYLDMLTAHYKALGASELIMAFEDQGLKEYLKKIEELIRLGRHEGIDFFFHKRKDIRMAFSSIVSSSGSETENTRYGLGPCAAMSLMNRNWMFSLMD